MKIAYGTYATNKMPLEDSLIMMANIGYKGVEIAIGPKHIMPEDFSSSERQNLRKILEDLKLEVPGFLMLGGALYNDSKSHSERLHLTQQVIEMANDIGVNRTPVISTGSGGSTSNWESQKENLIRALEDYGKIAAELNAIIAVEPHFHAMVDRSDRAIWLMKMLDNPNIRLHFDIVHNFLMKEPIRATVNLLLPYTVHTHVTDAKIYGDKFELVLLGQGELDCVEYVKAMKDAGWNDFITVEVSAMVWSKEEYDPINSALISYNTIKNAFKLAGVN
ncbi:MAG: sugar phosphate isomerase/epimerase family protein [bacterium]